MKIPYGKDIIKEWVEAFRAEGLGIGFYYSLIDMGYPRVLTRSDGKMQYIFYYLTKE